MKSRSAADVVDIGIFIVMLQFFAAIGNGGRKGSCIVQGSVFCLYCFIGCVGGFVDCWVVG